VTSQAGQSFISSSGTSWTDEGTNNQGNLAIHGLVSLHPNLDLSAMLQPIMDLLVKWLAQMFVAFPQIKVPGALSVQ
jgi:hypothetical protein